MSQYIFEAHTKNGNKVEVLLGWDNPLEYFFMVIDSDDSDEPLYSNLFESDPASLDLPHFQRVLEGFGINDVCLKPETTGIYEVLINDKDNYLLKIPKNN